MNSLALSQRVALAHRLADAAGEVLRRYFRVGPLPSTTKDEVSSIVTVADTEAERVMRQLIQEEFPEDGIIGEEEGTIPSSNGISWVLDPIDGTSMNYYDFCALIPIVEGAGGVITDWSGKPLTREST